MHSLALEHLGDAKRWVDIRARNISYLLAWARRKSGSRPVDEQWIDTTKIYPGMSIYIPQKDWKAPIDS